MRYSSTRLEKIARLFLHYSGSQAQEVDLVSRHLVTANLRGHDSHGLGMIHMYADYLKDGRLQPNTPLEVLQDKGVVLQFSGLRGYGQRIGYEATEQAIERAKALGLCVYTIKHSCHLGRIGSYGEQVADAGLISLHFVNVLDYMPMVAPFGAREGRFGTNPICIALPKTAKHERFILDFATSVVAVGKTRVAMLAGKKFDEPIAVSADGAITNDPNVMWKAPTGALLACAKHKGSGLSFACELLAGLLSQGGTLQPGNPRNGSIGNCMFSIVLDPSVFCNLAWMHQEMDAMMDFVLQAPPCEGHERVLMPGDPERRSTQDRLTHGIEISEGEWQTILQACHKVGVPDHALEEALKD